MREVMGPTEVPPGIGRVSGMGRECWWDWRKSAKKENVSTSHTKSPFTLLFSQNLPTWAPLLSLSHVFIFPNFANKS